MADEDEKLPFISRLVQIERFQREFFPILVLNENIANLAQHFGIGQLTMRLFTFFGNTHGVGGSVGLWCYRYCVTWRVLLTSVKKVGYCYFAS